MNRKEISIYIGEHLRQLGIKKNDNIVIHSDLTSIGIYHKDLPKVFFSVLNKIIGKNGTLALPLYNTSLDKSKIINLDKDFGLKENSFLSKYFFKKYKPIRTNSIFHSHLIKGKIQNKFKLNKNFNSFGKNSDFDFFFKYNFKLFLFGCDAAKGCTYLHHIEDKFKTKYRKKKTFLLRLKKRNKIFKKKIFYKVRAKNVFQNFNKIFFLPKVKKITKMDKLKNGKSYVVNIKEFDFLCIKKIKKKPNILNL